MNAETSLFTTDYTYHYSKYSCVKGFYQAHVIFSYFVGITGLFALVSRVHPMLHKSHKWWGRAYIINMLWATGTSMLIHNTGLPDGVLVSFLWVCLGLTIGWVLINVHMEIMEKTAAKNVGEALKLGAEVPPEGLSAALGAEKARIAASKTWMQRFFSLKALHGMLMFTSWVNIVGRIFVTPLEDFECYTYPVYKPINTTHFSGAGQPLTPVETYNPNAKRLPWVRTGVTGWGFALSVGPMAGAAVVGLITSFVAARNRVVSRTSYTPKGGQEPDNGVKIAVEKEMQ